jgi:N-acetyl-anhydromuramyl-L-alanine amidase AmpD
MIRITKTIKVKADYDITKEFDSVEELMNELRDYGYEGEYDEENQEFIDALNNYFDEPMYVSGYIGNVDFQHRLDDIQIDTDNFETYYTLR